MIPRISKIFLLSFLIGSLLLPEFLVFSETDPLEERQALEEELKVLEEQISQYEKEISVTEQEKKSLENKIYILKNQIKKLDLQIYQSNIIIRDLGLQITDTKNSIQNTSQNIEDSKEKISYILRTIYEEDQRSLVEVLIAEGFSSFFDNLVALDVLNSKNQEILEDIKKLKTYLENQKESLDEEKEEVERIVQIQSLQKQEGEQTKKNQEYFLKLTETQYQKYLQEKSETEKRVAEIRAKIYELIGLRKVVTYEEALEVAKYAASQVGIRPALLLGVLSQESAIGRNVGQCYVKNTSTGAGVVAYNGKIIDRVMNPTRDIPHFLNIIKKLNSDKGLNLDPLETLVSCPMSFGWGGAMGPAQFIPSTWVLYENKIKEKIGSSPDPWDLRDASFAASIYLKDGINRYGTEGKAVQAYFCGSPTNTYWCSWYEKNVVYLADCHQNFISSGSMSLECQEAIGLK